MAAQAWLALIDAGKARPLAVMDALRFGPADAPDTARVLPGVVGGISFYGNWDNKPIAGFSGSDYGTTSGISWTFGSR